MANHGSPTAATGNLFLDTLPASSLKQLLPALSLVNLKRGQVITEAGIPATEIYFPIGSLISTVTRMANGGAVEVGIAGCDGFSSMSHAFGRRVSPHTTVVQIGDSAYCGSAERFTAQFQDDAGLRARALNYAQYVFIAATQFAACNRMHAIEQRYARWILMANDRMNVPEFALTQEYVAQMLGVRRAGVTTVAGDMMDARVVAHRRGHITVLDHDRLEALSCECYGIVNAALRAVMGYDIRSRSTEAT